MSRFWPRGWSYLLRAKLSACVCDERLWGLRGTIRFVTEGILWRKWRRDATAQRQRNIASNFLDGTGTTTMPKSRHFRRLLIEWLLFYNWTPSALLGTILFRLRSKVMCCRDSAESIAQRERPLVRMKHYCGGRSYVSNRSSIAALSCRWLGHRLMLHDCVLACKRFSTSLFYFNFFILFQRCITFCIFLSYIFFSVRRKVCLFICARRKGVFYLNSLAEGSLSMNNKYGPLYVCKKCRSLGRSKLLGSYSRGGKGLGKGRVLAVSPQTQEVCLFL